MVALSNHSDMLHIELLPTIPDGGEVRNRHAKIDSQVFIQITVSLHVFFNNSLSNIFIHSFLKEKYRGAVQLSCAENLLKTQDRIYTIIGYAFLAIGRVQSLRGRPARPGPSGFHIKNQENLSANIPRYPSHFFLQGFGQVPSAV